MILQISCEYGPATLKTEDQIKKKSTRDIGFLLHKNPDSFLDVDLKFGTAHIFYTEATDRKTTLTMLLDINTLDLAKGDYGYSGSGLFEYVNDGAFAVNSFMSAAIKKVFSTAIAGNCKDRPDLLEDQPGDMISVSLYGVKCSEVWANKYFGPIFDKYNSVLYNEEYQCILHTSKSKLLDEKFDEFGDTPYLDIWVTYNSKIYLRSILQQVYVFIMTCVYKGHSYMSKDEFTKVRSYTENWIDIHPYRNNILHRYFSGIENYYRDYLNIYYPLSDKQLEKIEEDRKNRPEGLGTYRKRFIKEKVSDILNSYGLKEIKTVVELGCGEGKQIWNLIEDPSLNIKNFIGLEINQTTISRANRNLKDFDNYEIFQGSMLYRDSRIKDADIVLAIEVIEHIDPDKLDLFKEVVFNYIKPKFFILTTPNISYNYNYGIKEGSLRHSDHRFEFDRDGFMKFIESIRKDYDYEVNINSNGNLKYWYNIGQETEDGIAPTFGTVLYREDMI